MVKLWNSKDSIIRKMAKIYILLIVIPTVFLVFILIQFFITRYNSEIEYKNKTILNSLNNAIVSKIELIENIAGNISLNGQLISFLQIPDYTEYDFYTIEYKQKVAPIVQYAMVYPGITFRRIVIFFSRNKLPEGFWIFFKDDFVKKYSWIKQYIDTENDSSWIYLSGKKLNDFMQTINPHGGASSQPGFIYLKRIENSKGEYLGVVVIQIVVEELFSGTNYDKKADNLLIFDNDFNIVYSNFLNAKNVFDKKYRYLKSTEGTIRNNRYLISYKNIKPLGNFYIGYVTSSGLKSSYFQLIFIACIVLSSFLTITLYYNFLRHIFVMLNTNIEKMDYSISHNFNSRLEINGNDEIDQISRKFNLLIDKINWLIEENIQKETAHKNAQLRALQYQLNSHFIYNTLEILASRLELDEQYELSDAITEFSNLLRYNLKDDSMYSTLKEEIEYVKSFITIQKLRFKNRISLDVNLPDELKSVKIPKFIIHPLVENCVFHGIDKNEQNSFTIKIDFYQNQHYLHIFIEDNGKGFTQYDFLKVGYRIQNKKTEDHQDGHLGIGIANIHNRLKLFYGNEYKLIIESKAQQGTRIGIKVPVREVL